MDELVKAFMTQPNDHSEDILKICVDIQEGKHTILDLIEELGPHLTSTNTDVRIKGCKFLAEVLENLNESFLLTKELSALVVFFCSRLQDHYTLQPSALKGLAKITSCTNLADSDVDILLKSLFKEVHVPSCLQAERYSVYLILVNIVNRYLPLILSDGKDFVYNVIQAIDGEQDPRNLVIVFQLVYGVIMSGIDISSLAEELFDVSSCYFPIDFDPSASSKNFDITKQDLVSGLRKVLSSTDEFAQYCIPLMLEKLDSDIENAKLDALLTLSECILCYKKSDLEPFLATIWVSLKREILQSVSEDVETHSLNLLTQLVKRLSEFPVDERSNKMVEMHCFLKQLVDDCVTRLREPMRDKLTWMSWRMLMACAKASRSSCEIVMEVVLPLLLLQANDDTSTETTKSPLPTGFENVIDSMVKATTICGAFTFSEHPVLPYKNTILTLFQNVLLQDSSSVTIKRTAVAGLASLMNLNILIEDDLHEITNCILTLLQIKLETKLRDEILSVSGYLSSKYSEVVKSDILPQLFEMIPETEFWKQPTEHVHMVFECLAAFSAHFLILKEVTLFIVTFLQKCMIDKTYSSFIDKCLSCLQTISKDCAAEPAQVEHLALNVALPLIKICIETSLELSTPEECCSSCSSVNGFSIDCISLPIIKTVATVLCNIFQKLCPGVTADFVVKLLADLYLDNNVTAFDITATNPITFEPFNPTFSFLQSRTICFLSSTICVLDKSVVIPRVEDYQSRLLDLCLKSSDQPTYVAAAKAFAGLVNRFCSSSDSFIQKVANCILENDYDNKVRTLTLLIWTTKALALCNHEKTIVFVKKLVDAFSDPDVGEIAAAGCDIIMRDSEENLCKSTHAVIKLMYRQRFFLLLIPELVSGFQTGKEGSAGNSGTAEVTNGDSGDAESKSRTKPHYLTALSYVLLHLPKQVLLQQFSNLVPLLVHSLHSDDPNLLKSVLSALYYLIQDAVAPMEIHIDSLMDYFLKLTRFQQNMDVRIKAIQCIGASTLLSTPLLLPMKSKVIKELRFALDDRKRSVRTEGIKARSQWFLVGV